MPLLRPVESVVAVLAVAVVAASRGVVERDAAACRLLEQLLWRTKGVTSCGTIVVGGTDAD